MQKILKQQLAQFGLAVLLISSGQFAWGETGDTFYPAGNTLQTNQAEPVETTAPSVLKLQDAIDTVIAENPGLAAIQARANALAAVPSQKNSLPDPMLMFNAMNLPVDSFDLQQEAMTQLQVGFSQMLPYPGKLALREEVAEHEQLAARWNVDEMRLKLVRDVKTAWWNLFFLDRALDIIARNRQLLQQLVDIAQTKYRVGKGLQQDVLLAQLELSKLEDKTINLRGTRRNQEARLNALLNRPMRDQLTLPGKMADTLAEISNAQQLQALARGRPLLSALQSKVEAARARLNLAKKGYYPDFKLGAVYGFRNGNNMNGSSRADFLSVMLSINIPLYADSRQDKKVDERTSQLHQTQYGLQDEQGKIAAAVSQALSDYQQARKQVSLLKTGIIPQASQTVASMLSAYQVSKVDFLNLVRAQITLFNYEIRYWKLFSQANQALARLVAAAGWEATARRGSGGDTVRTH